MDKYIGYIRVSNKEHDTSVPTQELKMREYEEKQGIDIVKIYVEEKSAFRKSKRKEFSKALKHLAQDDIKGVVFHKVDRSARNMKDFGKLEEFFDTKDVRVIEGEFDTSSAQGRFQFRIFCSMAVWYSENLSEEVTMKMTQRLRDGYYPANSPFGYRKGIKGRDKDWKKKYPNHNAKYVKEIFQLYDSGIHTYRSIAKIMKTKSLKNSQGGSFTKGTIEKILSNPFYYGVIKWVRRSTGKELYFEGNHEPIISKELFDRVENRKKGRANQKGSYGKLTYSRIFTCGCGKLLYPEKPTSRSGRRDYVYLRCHNKQCNFSSIREDKMEDLIVTEISKYQFKSSFLKQYKSAINDMNAMVVQESKNKRKKVNMRLGQIESELERIRRGYLNEVFDEQEAKKMRIDLKLERETLLKEIRQECNALDEALFKITQNFLETFKSLSNKYKTADSSVKREVLEFLFSNHILSKGKLILKPKPIVQQVTTIANLQYGRGYNTQSETFSQFKASFLSLSKFIQENDMAEAVRRLNKAFMV